MGRRVFFSFDYADIMNASIVRNSGQFKPTAETGFYDASLWEEAKTKGDAAVRRLIDKGLNNTRVSAQYQRDPATPVVNLPDTPTDDVGTVLLNILGPGTYLVTAEHKNLPQIHLASLSFVIRRPQ